MKSRGAGFTLVELLVVIVIMGILAAVAVPFYMKANETTMASDAMAILKMVATANKTWNVDYGFYAPSQLYDVNPASPRPQGVCATTIADSCNLTACSGYLTPANYSCKPYDFYACDPATGNGGGCCGPNLVACAQRKPAGATLAICNNIQYGKNTLPYSTWKFTIDRDGSVASIGTNVPQLQ